MLALGIQTAIRHYRGTLIVLSQINLKITNKMSLVEKFNAAAEKVKTFTKRPTDEELLDLYALFKQATVGDNNTSKPGMLDLKGKAKWEWWNKQKGKSQDVAKQEYIEFVEKLSASYL
uniref:Acyl-CoA-binding protein homolog n=1 Tax=Zeugodacus cucurbitae TaxID=28588 RepID=A0A0A1WE75_ZEUCU